MEENNPRASLLEKSQAEHYVTRHTWEVPPEGALLKRHPLTDEPFWKLILRKVGVTVSDSAVFSEERPHIDRHWHEFLELMSWWELRRYFNRQGNSLVLKPQADVVVVHPVGRFAQARTDAEWKDACHWTLLAHCNHGEMCQNTFRDAEQLGKYSYEATAELMERFVLASSAERASSRLAPCPPHIRKAWHLGMARRKRAAEQQHSVSRVANLLATTTYKFVFEEGASWQEVPWESMTEEDQAVAKRAWDKAELPPVADSM